MSQPTAVQALRDAATALQSCGNLPAAEAAESKARELEAGPDPWALLADLGNLVGCALVHVCYATCVHSARLGVVPHAEFCVNLREKLKEATIAANQRCAP